ncbi:MAG: 2-hydroxyhepta-2,4-diene-1,7-dioate isomerase [Akkermansiaceae bacterium]|nr:2-hydroxyhepta-2,4-diene-1,7-dioate isomerase [Akkermansiaceae bacterium]NNM31319.1 2-hydroxyhepta-2,4-diene-1,7-dioate isomerase [Akkermansiaceae bacterium]
MFRVYRHHEATWIESGGEFRRDGLSLDDLFTADDPLAVLAAAWKHAETAPAPDGPWLPPVGNQEIWAAGVTYYRSRTARMEESEAAGGDRFYDLVYDAERPELFFKSTAARARGHRQPVGIRSDSSWDVPEPELTLAINSSGKVFGATVGNDMSSRSIEGENPLYLPQAKIYNGSCALGPALLVGTLPGPDDAIHIVITRDGHDVFSGNTKLNQLKRSYDELASFLFRDSAFPRGAFLMTGTGIVPDPPFTLQPRDEIHITIDQIGTLSNPVAPAADIR